MKKELSLLATENSLEKFKLEETYFGIINNYHILVKIHEQSLLINFPYENVNEQVRDAINDEFKDLMDEIPKKERFKLSKAAINKNGFTIYIMGKKKNINKDNISLVISLITDIFDKYGIDKISQCKSCGVTTSEYAFLAGKIVPYCDSCVEDINEGNSETKFYQYITGLIGGMLGAIVGIVPYLFIAFQFSYLIGVLAFLPGFASIKLYGIFKGPKVKWYAIIVIIFSTFIVLGYPSAFLLLSHPEDAAFTFLFGMIGLFYARSEIKKYTDHSNPIPLKEF